MADPGQGTFDDPALRQDDEAMEFVALDDLQLPATGLCDGGRDFRTLVAGIGEDALDEREQAAGAAIEDQSRAVAVLDIGGMDDDIQ